MPPFLKTQHKNPKIELFWPRRTLRRDSNSLRSPSMMAATSGSFARARNSAGKDDLLGPVALGDEAGAPRGHLVEPLEHDREVRARDGVVEPQDDVSRAHALAVAHEQFADDPAGRMLDLLHVGIDHDRCRRDDGAGQLGGRGPAADAADQQDGDDGAAEEMMADRAALVVGLLVSSDHPFVWDASLSGVGLTGTRGAARARTSSFGPKVCCLPWFISST